VAPYPKHRADRLWTSEEPWAAPVAEMKRRCDNRHVPLEGHLYGERVWFHDTRSPVRRMGVSAHPVDSTMVISLWQGDVCTGTFRLPTREAARLISALAFGMSDAIPARGPAADSAPDPSRRIRRGWIRRLFLRSPVTSDPHLRLLE